jgi:HEPN domain-containing protein
MSARPDEVARAEARRWLASGWEDRGVVEMALERSPSFMATAGFHTQQSAEKLVKALLVLAARPFPKTHNMARLLALLGPVPGLSDECRKALADLTPWAAHTRYPMADDEDLPGTAEIRTALGQVDELATLVRAAIDAP